jgi:hypothetical protein
VTRVREGRTNRGLGNLLHRATLLLATVGCAAPGVAAAPASPEAHAPDRVPDGVALAPAPALPSPASHAEAGGVVALRVPVSREAVASFLRTFFAAWARESMADLEALLLPDAGSLDSRGHGSHAKLLDGWRQRMRAHDYGRLAGVQMVQPDRIERWEPDELGSGAPGPIEVRPGEIEVRIPVEAPLFAGDRLFGDAIVMLLRPEGGALRIAAYGEVEAR